MAFEELKSFLREQNSIDWIEVNEGIVCNYRDGCDYELLREQPPAPQEWIKCFKVTSDRRWRFINGLRWWARQRNKTLVISANGNGSLEGGGYSTALELGRELTSLLKTQDVLDVLDDFLKPNWITIKNDEFENALKLGSFIEASPDHGATTDLEVSDMEAAISSIFQASALVSEDELVRAIKDKNVDGILAKHPAFALSQKLAKHFGTKFGIDICTRDFYIEYDDDEDHEVKYRSIKKRLSKQSVDSVFSQICSEYEVANRQRNESQITLFSHMASLGYAVDESDEGYFFGRDKREYCFNPETDLKSNDVKSDLICWLKIQGLPHSINSDVSVQITKRPLPSNYPQAVSPLEAYDLTAIDIKAKDILEKYRDNGNKYPHEHWSSPRWYQPDKDLWMNEAWWVEQANKHNDDLLLAVFGDKPAHERIIQHMKSLADFGWSGGFSIYEGYCPIAAFMAREQAWPDENPVSFYAGHEAAAPEKYYWLSFFDKLPYEIKRHAQGLVRDFLNDPEDDELERVERSLKVFKSEDVGLYFAADEIKKIHQLCIDVASKPIYGGWFDDAFLMIAYKFGWTDILRKLAHNETFWQLWATWPGSFTYSGDFALTLSLFGDSSMVQRLAAWVLEINEGDIEEQFTGSFGYDYCLPHIEEQQLRAALAWSRTRKLF